MYREKIGLFEIVCLLFFLFCFILCFFYIINYEYDVYEYCYHYVTLDNEEFDYCSEKEVCSKSSKFRPETSCEIDGKYFLVKELEVNKKFLRKTSIAKGE